MAEQPVAILKNQGADFTFTITTATIPTIQPREVLVCLEVTGFCVTDLSLARGHLGPCNTILGHEGIGRIVAVGAMCEARAAAVGQRVGIGWIRDACGACPNCMSAGAGETRCTTQVFSGRDVAGTLARYAVVPERYLVPLPEESPSELLAPIMCAGVTAYKALKVANVTPGSWIGVSGAAGGVGSLAVQYAKAMGYRTVAIDGGGGPRQRAICLEAGADVYLDYEEAKPDLRANLLRATGGDLCAAVLVCAGAATAYEDALPCLAYFGVLVAVGIPPPTSKVSFHPLTLIDYGIRFVGSITGDRRDVLEAVQFVLRGLVKPRTVLIDLVDLNNYARQVNQLPGKLVVRLGDDAIQASMSTCI
ncbi:alcohol dehydrogenase [Aspergillus aculeatinus CBS 121060]|uniref:Alcohol dehydrogenase n=1 Tax=Aspergillus aculeatinus CBS 121060 TaxID=1448322 RepID=A0ACD1HLD2_9EURO|nr:alcohol dehydrogenase [Aspergillus aculeatinus CBS 121060]RAH74215.1 alcohol dehydrogenase [Aspergillus aculeatinus CBS 121060]